MQGFDVFQLLSYSTHLFVRQMVAKIIMSKSTIKWCTFSSTPVSCWNYALVLVLLLAPPYVSTDFILVDSQSLGKFQGNDIFVLVSSIGWVTYAIIGNFDPGTDKAVCFTKETVVSTGALIKNSDAGLNDTEKKWHGDVLSGSNIIHFVLKDNEFRPQDIIFEDLIEQGQQNFVPIAQKGKFNSQHIQNFLNDLGKEPASVSLESCTMEGAKLITLCANVLHHSHSQEQENSESHPDIVIIPTDVAGKKDLFEKSSMIEKPEQSANNRASGSTTEETTVKHADIKVSPKKAESEKESTQNPNKKKKPKRPVNSKKSSEAATGAAVVTFLTTLLEKSLTKPGLQMATAKMAEENTKTLFYGSIQMGKGMVTHVVNEGTKQTYAHVTQQVAVGSFAKVVEKGTQQTVTGFAVKAGVVTGEKIVKEGAHVTVQACQATVQEVTAFGIKRQIAQKGTEALTMEGTKQLTKAGTREGTKFVVKEGSKQAVKGTAQGSVTAASLQKMKGTMAASALFESAILGYKVYQSYEQLESGEISKEEFQEQVMSDIGSAGGSVVGTTAGAAFGTMLFPVVGTFVGSVVGGMVGSYIGSAVGVATESVFDE